MPSRGIINKSYYDNSNFINVFYSTILSIFNFFTENFFPDDPNRIIYASNTFAFRERLKLQDSEEISAFQVNSLNMPFMNFSISSSGITPNTERTWKNYSLEVEGMMDWDINKKIRATPVKMDFECTYFSDREADLQYVMSKILWINSQETLIRPELEIDGKDFQNIGLFVGFDTGYRSQYNESDWLEKNKIRTIGMNFSVDTFFLDTTTDGFWIPKKVLVSFAKTHDLAIHDWEDYDELWEGVIDHIGKQVVF
jgi:hypothetical protein